METSTTHRCDEDGLVSHDNALIIRNETVASVIAQIIALKETNGQQRDELSQVRKRLLEFESAEAVEARKKQAQESDLARNKAEVDDLRRRTQANDIEIGDKRNRVQQQQELLRQLNAKAAIRQPKLEYVIKSTTSKWKGKKQRAQDAPPAQ